MVEKKRRWACRLGFHQLYNNTSGTNLGTDAHPVWMVVHTKRCNYCDYVEAVLR